MSWQNDSTIKRFSLFKHTNSHLGFDCQNVEVGTPVNWNYSTFKLTISADGKTSASCLADIDGILYLIWLKDISIETFISEHVS